MNMENESYESYRSYGSCGSFCYNMLKRHKKKFIHLLIFCSLFLVGIICAAVGINDNIVRTEKIYKNI